MPRITAGTRTAVTNRFKIRDFSTCLNFSANAANKLVFSNVASLHFTTAVSVMAWIKPAILPALTTTTQTICINAPDNISNDFIFHMYTNRRLRFVAAGGTDVSGTADVLRAGVWQHVALTFSSSGSNNIKFYVNGVAAGTGERAFALSAGSNDFLIGNRNAADRYLNSLMDEFKVFNTTLTPAQILDEYYRGTSSATGLVLYTKFDEGSGTSATDSSATQSAGTITGATYSTDVKFKTRTVVA